MSKFVNSTAFAVLITFVFGASNALATDVAFTSSGTLDFLPTSTGTDILGLDGTSISIEIVFDMDATVEEFFPGVSGNLSLDASSTTITITGGPNAGSFVPNRPNPISRTILLIDNLGVGFGEALFAEATEFAIAPISFLIDGFEVLLSSNLLGVILDTQPVVGDMVSESFFQGTPFGDGPTTIVIRQVTGEEPDLLFSDYAITNFQVEVADVPTTLLGDVNLDGVVTLLDVGPFVDLLSNGGFQLEADLNQDGLVTLLDVGPFVDAIANGGG